MDPLIVVIVAVVVAGLAAVAIVMLRMRRQRAAPHPPPAAPSTPVVPAAPAHDVTRPATDPGSQPRPITGLESALERALDRSGRPLRERVEADTADLDARRSPDDTGPLLGRALDQVAGRDRRTGTHDEPRDERDDHGRDEPSDDRDGPGAPDRRP